MHIFYCITIKITANSHSQLKIAIYTKGDILILNIYRDFYYCTNNSFHDNKNLFDSYNQYYLD